ncbi:MAG: helix-turn-helix transcriptional regulator, partial [Arcobacteraceae bacterium]
MNKRLEEVRQYLGLSKTDFADTLGLKIHNIRDMETGKQKIGAEIATLIEEIFSISGWWLLTGKGSMLQQPQKSSTQNIQGNGNVSVNGFGNKVTKSGNTVAKQAEINSDLVEIPYFRDTYAAAGAGAINYD